MRDATPPVAPQIATPSGDPEDTYWKDEIISCILTRNISKVCSNTLPYY